MSIPIIFHPEALISYFEASVLGEQFQKAIDEKIKQIVGNPQYYSTARGAYRQATVEEVPFTIVYKFRVRKNQLLIAAVHHTGRNPGQVQI